MIWCVGVFAWAEEHYDELLYLLPDHVETYDGVDETGMTIRRRARARVCVPLFMSSMRSYVLCCIHCLPVVPSCASRTRSRTGRRTVVLAQWPLPHNLVLAQWPLPHNLRPRIIDRN